MQIDSSLSASAFTLGFTPRLDERSAQSSTETRAAPSPPSLVPALVAVWAGFSLLGATQTYLSMLSHGHSYVRILFCQSAVWSLWALLTPAVFRLAGRFPLHPFSLRSLGVHLLSGVVLSVAHVAACVALTIWIRPYDAMSPTHFGHSFVRCLPYNLQLELLLYAMIIGAAHARAYYAGSRAHERDAERFAAELARARLATLELQLRPHFLFNTLHTIGGLVRLKRDGEAVNMLGRLGDLLRECLTEEPEHEVALRRELLLFDKYVDIERVRFSDRLSITVDAPAELQRALVPRFILQPLAENAMRHGISQVAGPAQLALLVRRDGDRLIVELFNSAAFSTEIGPKKDLTSGLGIGLRNTESRLRALYGERATLTLRRQGSGFIAALSLPYRESSAAEAV